MFCFPFGRKFIGHKLRYGLVKEPHYSTGDAICQCQRCGEHWILEHKLRGGKFVGSVWVRLGWYPEFAVAPVWFATEAELMASIQQRED